MSNIDFESMRSSGFCCPSCCAKEGKPHTPECKAHEIPTIEYKLNKSGIASFSVSSEGVWMFGASTPREAPPETFERREVVRQ